MGIGSWDEILPACVKVAFTGSPSTPPLLEIYLEHGFFRP
jgi:hypothetical protein